MADRARSWGLFAWMLVLGCAEVEAPLPVGATEPRLISGTDDRRPPEQVADEAFAEAARGFVAALVIETRVEQDGEGNPYLSAMPLYERHSDDAEVPLCRDERFALEPTPAYCSGTLIAPDLLLTAGHCVLDAAECEETAIVFGFEADASSEVQTLAADDIYGCAELIVQSEPEWADYAVLRLDRPVTDREPATIVRDARSLPLGEAITMAGHPLGLPLKITTGGRTRPIPLGYPLSDPDYFGADLDTFPGNSGSGGFLSATDNPHPLVGVLSSVIDIGSFTYDATRDCERYERHGEVMVWLTYSYHALDALCDDRAEAYPELCSCGDGTCSAAFGEDGTTCATDCDDACGDHLCLGSETTASCAADCACGDGACTAGEECCSDCGCDDGFLCEDAACVPELGADDPGFDCQHPIDLAVSATVTTLERSTLGAHDSNQCTIGTTLACVAPDHHYAFTLEAPASITAIASGYDHVALQLRTAPCSSSAVIETAIDRNGTGRARLHRVLQPGVYRLVVDGEAEQDRGAYALEVSFATPPLIDGDDCSAPIVLSPSGAYTVSGNTTDAANDRSSAGMTGCAMRTFGNDRFYTFTLTEKTRIDASVTAEHGAALLLTQGACGAPLRCVPEGNELRRVLDPGTYMLVVEGEESFDAGPYVLALDFTASPPLEGESCEDALVLTASGVQHVTGSADGLADDIDTSCTDIPSSDRVYTFTLATQRTLRTTVQGDGQAYVALGTSCAPDASAVCLPLSGTPRAQNRTLDAGTYFLVIDADETAGGAYDITIHFDSEPLGESCSDALALAIGEAPITVSGAGHASAASRDLYYAFTLPGPSHLDLDAEAPGKLWVTGGLDTIYRSGGKLATDVPAGTYCVHVSGPLVGAALELTALAAPLAEPGGRGCDDAIPLAASGGHALSGYASFGRLTECSVFPAQLYAFELTETTRLRAIGTPGFSLALFRDEACSELARCSGGSSNVDTSLAPGHYKLAVAGPPFVGYDLRLGFDCDPVECAVAPPPREDGGEPEPPDAGVEGGVDSPDSSLPESDAMSGEPAPDSGSDGPDASDDGGAVADAEADAAPDGSDASSDCACRAVAPRPASPRALLGAGLLALAVVLRAKRREHLSSV